MSTQQAKSAKRTTTAKGARTGMVSAKQNMSTRPNRSKSAVKQSTVKKAATQKPPTKKTAAKKSTPAKSKKTTAHSQQSAQYRLRETSPLLKKKTNKQKRYVAPPKPGKAKSIIYLGHATRWNYQEHLYEPLKHSHFGQDFELVLPHEKSLEPWSTKEVIRNSNVMLAEVSYPSTGLGIEMGWAEEFDVPIIAFYQHGRSPTQCLKIVVHDVFAYGSTSELIKQLNQRLHIDPIDESFEFFDHEGFTYGEEDD